MVTLDEVIDEDVLLLKIDTEGFEDSVLKGAQVRVLLLNHYVYIV